MIFFKIIKGIWDTGTPLSRASVGYEDCSLDLIFLKLGTGHLVFWLGEGLIFPTA